MRCAPLLIAVALAPLLAEPARACSPPPEGWMMQQLLPAPGDLLPPDGPLILLGEAFSPIDLDLVISLIDLRLVDSAGVTVTGTLEPGVGADDLMWWPDAPLTPDARYSVLLASLDEREWQVRLREPEPEPLQVGDAAVSGSAAMAAPALETFTRPINGACLQDGFCGGCEEFERLGEEVHWQASVQVTLPTGPYAAGRVARMALGADVDEAMTILDRTPPHGIGEQSVVQVGRTAGAVSAWPAASACAAVEVIDPVAGTLIREATCFAVPDAERPVGAQPTREVSEPVEPEPTAPDGIGSDVAGGDDAPGCDASGLGGGGSTGWAALLGLLAVSGLGRRRRLAAVAALIGLAASGCGSTGDADGGAGRSTEPCPFGECSEPEPLPPVVAAEHIPPPIMGGALATTATRAVVGDPDRDQVLVVDLTGQRPTMSHRGGQPGRVAIDDAGERAYVTLRSDGQVLALNLSDGTAIDRFPVCAAPRGVAVHGPKLYVACAGGNLLTLDAASGAVERRLPLAPDLRDVMVVGDHIHVSRFRQPELITLDRDGAVIARRAPAVRDALHHRDPSAPTVAWRTIALPSGAVLMLHQRARLSTVVTTTPGGYGGGEFDTCGSSIVSPELTLFPAPGADDTTPRSVGIIGAAVLAVDVALVDGAVVVAAPGNGDRLSWQMTALTVDLDDPTSWDGCLRTNGRFTHNQGLPPGLTAVAEHAGQMIGFRREIPALVDLYGETVAALPGDAIEDTGHALFHADAGQGIACASCHPEGSEDGHAWLFEGHGLRRTQELRGGLAGSAPFHWTGDMRDMQHLMDEVMTRRMGGPEIPPAYTEAMLRWIDAQPVERVDPIGTGDAIAGQLVFEDEMVGCAACHSGARLTDDEMYDVGTGGRFSTPTLLGIGRRGALMHDSCGATLADRFDPSCGGGERHGRTAHLGADDLRDLIAYLSTL